MFGTSAIAGMVARKGINMAKNHVVQKEIDNNLDAQRLGIAQDYANLDPAAAAEHMVAQTNAQTELEKARQQGKTRRTIAMATVGTVAIGAAAGGYLYTTNKLGDLFNGLKPVVPHEVTEEDITAALQGVRLSTDRELSAGLVKSNAELKSKLISCTFLGCVTLTGRENDTTRLQRLSEVAKPGTFSFDAEQTVNPDGSKSFSLKAFVDPANLELRSGDPTAEDLESLGLPADIQTVNNGGEDGKLMGLAEGVANALNLIDEDGFASRSEYTYAKASAAGLANCGPVLGQIRENGIAKVAHDYIAAAVDIAEDLGTSESTATAKALEELLEQPITIQYRSTTDNEASGKPPTYRNLDPSEIDLYDGPAVKDKSVSEKDLTGPNKVVQTVTTSVNNECVVTPAALNQILDIKSEADFIVLDAEGNKLDKTIVNPGDL